MPLGVRGTRGLTHTSSFGIFPFCGLEDEEEDPLGPEDSASQQGSGVEGVGGKRTREARRAPSSLAASFQAVWDEEGDNHRARRLRPVADEGLETPPQPAKKTKATRISVETQIQAKMGALTGLTPRLERVQDLGDAQKLALLQQGRIEVAEILRLCRLEPGEFEEELKDMRYLEEGLLFAFNTQQYDMGVLWLRKKLRDACGGGVAVDFKQMEKEFTTVKEVAGLPKNGPQRAAAVQTLALAPAFHGAYGTDPAMSFEPFPAFVQDQTRFPFAGPGYGTGQGYVRLRPRLRHRPRVRFRPRVQGSAGGLVQRR